ncbi:MAG: DUF3298 domain-containing protein [Bacteroides sp.]|nr:DUF3298 domain-containing protein [Bacteroides sp.]MCM1414107.1 DUF3298 domain-containing protein [Bacteroides sp.]MCM1472371.1 DUF3298 domain-containing protein [Bacteroides sp.]
MKRYFLPFAAALALLSTGICSCSDKYDSSAKSDEESASIESMPFNFDMKSAKKYYRISNSDTDYDYTLTLEANVMWPEQIGDFDIKPLQDTIMSLVAGKHVASINSAISQFVSDAKRYELGDKITEVDSVPETSAFNTAFYAQVDVMVSEISGDYINFVCNNEEYLGGAHPMYGSAPFTYNLSTGKIVTLKSLFNNPESPQLLAAVKDALLQHTSMTAEEFDQTALVSPLPLPTDVYLENGMIVFHYNPYAILPYSFGSIDAEVSPYVVKDLLTPEAKKALVD